MIKTLKKSIIDFYHIDTEFILFLYEISDSSLEPIDFAKRLNIYNGDLNNLLNAVMDQKSGFTHISTFIKFENYIKNPDNKISTQDQNVALFILSQLRDVRQNDYMHRAFNYSFHWKQSRLDLIEERSLKKYLFTYLQDMYEERFPKATFQSNDNPGASSFQFIGSKNDPVETMLIKNFFKSLIRPSQHFDYLCKIVQCVFSHYKLQKYGVKPDHPPILSWILIHDTNSLAIEIPVWQEIQSTSETYIGHIDLLLYDQKELIIADYKQDEQEILKAIPQITIYATMFKERLRALGFSEDLHLKCVEFSIDVAYEFNPEAMIDKILDFINYEKKVSRRQDDLKTNDKNRILFDEYRKFKN